MISTLKNEYLEIKINTLGAELCSLKKVNDSTEYLWTADKEVWARHAPVLFPIVGKLKDNEYIYDDTTYSLSQHGFARDSEFEIIEQNDSTISYQLCSNNETLKSFPFNFKLIIKYTLKENNLFVAYNVLNENDKTMFFSIGAHPGFNCPLCTDESINDYYIELNKKETTFSLSLNKDGIISKEKTALLQEENIIQLNQDSFKNGVLIFTQFNSDEVSLKSKKSEREITVKFTGFPYLGLWGKEHNSPFVCLEPWFGTADFEDTNKNLKEKFGIQQLEANKSFEASYSVCIK